MKNSSFTAYIEKDLESGLFVGIVPEVTGALTQAETLDELNNNLKEVLTLCLEGFTEEEMQNLPKFFGIQSIEIAI